MKRLFGSTLIPQSNLNDPSQRAFENVARQGENSLLPVFSPIAATYST